MYRKQNPVFSLKGLNEMNTKTRPFSISHLMLTTLLCLIAPLGWTNSPPPPSTEATPETTETTPKIDMPPIVEMQTNKGAVVIKLNQEKAPISVANFLAYVDAGFYDGLIFHRVIPNFMIQGGGFTPDLKKKPTQNPIKNEAKNGLKNLKGTIAMARTQVVDSATAQFFINLIDNDFLNHSPNSFGYAVFGEVIEGMDVVEAIAKAPTERKGMHQNVPVEAVVIEKVVRKVAKVSATSE